MAFAITEDHARQEQVFANLHHNREPWIIRRDLTANNVPATDRRAVFVGADAYVEAGGNIIRDLFSEDRGGFFEDAGLLDMLAIEKLREIAAEVPPKITSAPGKGANASFDLALAGLRPARRSTLEVLGGLDKNRRRLTGRVVIAHRDIRHRCWAVMLPSTLIAALRLSGRAIERIGVPVSHLLGGGWGVKSGEIASGEVAR
jgi:hypothetical protein